MVRTTQSIRQHVEELASREPAFAKVLEKHGMPEPRISDRGAQTLLRTIVGQQVSIAAARSMWGKLEAAFGSPPDLKRLLAASDEELRAAGMSRQKSGYIRSLAELVISGELDYYDLPEYYGPPNNPLRVRNVQDPAGKTWFKAHIQYWTGKTLARILYDAVS